MATNGGVPEKSPTHSPSIYDSLIFTKGFVYKRNLIYFAGVPRSSGERYESFAVMLKWFMGEWGHWTAEDRINSICAFDNQDGRVVVAMGYDGRIQVAESSGQHWEIVDAGEEGPSNLRHLSQIRRIGSYLYVVGMARQVYRRPIAGGSWERADSGVLVSRKSLEIAGFNGFDGNNEQDIYAAGFYGQVWHYSRTGWRQLDTPTDVRLQCVRCIRSDLTFVCGAKGILLFGNADKWSVVQNDVTDHSFWGMEYFQNTIYLATNKGEIFKQDGDHLVKVNCGFTDAMTTNSLHANDGILLSIGSDDLVIFDGEQWMRL